MDLDRVAKRISEHPIPIILAFMTSVVAPCVNGVLLVLPLNLGLAISGVLLISLATFLVWPNSPVKTSTPVAQKPPVTGSRQIQCRLCRGRGRDRLGSVFLP